MLDVLPGLQSYYHVQGNLRTARELADQLVALTDGRPEEPHRLLDARRRLGWSLFWLGELTQAGENLEGALELYDPKDHQLHVRLYGDHPGVFSHCNLAWVRWAEGRTAEAERHSQAGLQLAEEEGHLLSLTYSTCVLSALCAARWDPIRAKDLAADPAARRRQWLSLLDGLGAHRAWLGGDAGRRPEDGIAELSKGIEDYASTGAELFRPYSLALLAEANFLMGRNEQAIVILDEALLRTRDKEIRFYKSELLRLKECLAGVRREYGRDRELPQSGGTERGWPGSLFLELRAATALASVYAEFRSPCRGAVDACRDPRALSPINSPPRS